MYIKRIQEVVAVYSKWKDVSGNIQDKISTANIISTKYEKVDAIDNSCESILDLKILVDEELFTIKKYKWLSAFKIDDSFAKTIPMTPYIVFNGVKRNWLNFREYYEAVSTMEDIVEKFKEESKKQSKIWYDSVNFININNNHLEAVRLIPDWNEIKDEMFYLIDLSDTGIL